MSRVGIITFHRAINYGAVMQTWALQTVLQSKGYDVFIIDYYADFLQKAYKMHPKNPRRFISKLFLRHKFKKFISKRLNLTSTCYLSGDDLLAHPPECDAYIVGSDTVWNSSIVGKDLRTYLLDFVPKHKRIISYAASLGGEGVIKQSYNVFCDLIPKFTAISLREPIFISQIQNFTETVKVCDVADPTLLLCNQDYDMLCGKIVSYKPLDNYIVAMDLAGDNFFDECIQQLQQQTGLKIVNMVGKSKRYAAMNYSAISPQKWLAIIRNAKYICTNSFHAVSLSCIYQKQFYCIAVKTGNRSHNNIRSENLLKQLFLVNRYVTDIAEINCQQKIDYDVVEPYWTKYKSKSLTFLSEALT